MFAFLSILLLITANLSTALPTSDPEAEPLIRRGNLPPTIALSTAKSYLSRITLAEESNSPPYDRDLFNHWIGIEGNCNTREYILRRDGTNVVTDGACTAVSGNWYSDYDGATWSLASDVDIDHVVPLKEAWVSGARLWTDAQREDFANDIDLPQLLAVTDNVNQQKGDGDLAEWLPSRVDFRCEYVRAWLQVKYNYELSMDAAEKEAASDVLYGVC